MAATLAVTDQWHDGKRLHVIGTITFSGNYTTGGDTLDFTTIGIESSQAPQFLDLQPQDSGYTGDPVYGTTPASGNKVRIWQAYATELSQAGYPAAISGTPWNFMAIFQMI